ncbi:MAG: transketolase [Bacteroidetes bacterium]|nr:transketolase [Bacteroidota bacterium]
MEQNLYQLSAHTIRTLSMDAVQKANSGHPGMPMGMADVATILWSKFLKHNPENPNWFDRDRFILSAGHGSMLLYSLLHLSGYDVNMEDLKSFRQMGSITPGHPEFGMTPGVEMTTGPLGQGFATGVGMAMAERFLGAKFNDEAHTLVDHYTYAIVSDGDLMEGVSHEAASLAGHLKLGKLIYLYDANSISIEGDTDLAFTENVVERFLAYGWQVMEIDGHNHGEIAGAIISAQKNTNKPSLIVCRTKIGFGSPNKEGKESSHGSPLGEDEIRLTKEVYGFDPNRSFVVDPGVYELFALRAKDGAIAQLDWQAKIDSLKNSDPEKYQAIHSWIQKDYINDLDSCLPHFEADDKGMATRASSGKVINAIKDALPNLIGGSADLGPSTKTDIEGYGSFTVKNPTGRTIHFGVREFGMAAAVNGMMLHGGVHAFGATFFVFTDYLRPALRLAALMKLPSIFVMTHDSIGLGEDGPTHQPIEHLASLRAMPNVLVIRPADANEVSQAWKTALEHTRGPSVLVLTRQNVPTYPRTETNPASLLSKGAYILSASPTSKVDGIVMATGSEVQLAMQAQAVLAEKGVGVQVVSMPSWELFELQPEEYKQQVLPADITKRVSIEAGSTFGWQKYLGLQGKAIGVDSFGESAPYKELYAHFNITKEAIIDYFS